MKTNETPCDGIISIASLPSDSSIVFSDSAFFTRNPDHALPSPADVRANQLPDRSAPVRFEELNLLVKYGKDITIAEGQCLWALRRLLLTTVPVPEVFGWTQDGSEFFIFMELVPGVTLENKWASLSNPQRIEICEQLRGMVLELRQLKQDPTDHFLGHISRKPLLDIVFTGNTKPPAGPFISVPEFHDWLSSMTKRGMERHWPDPSLIPDPFRDQLPDDSALTFTHADLHPSNILVSDDDEPCRVVALIDWHQSGWYPRYWEYCKAVFTAIPNGEWETEYIPRFLEAEDCHDAWAYYPQTLGY
ncbi:MAG: hypothetical protein M1829_000980 [Trizodia sp. TS-e1964]|nr:MAG: hypothetical protein M1829_000980 [Trizodia sp. TS-e1964]